MSLDTFEDRLHKATTDMVQAMPADKRAECETLIAMDPDDVLRGMRLHPDGELVHVSWCGLHLGSIRTSWLLDGETESQS